MNECCLQSYVKFVFVREHCFGMHVYDYFLFFRTSEIIRSLMWRNINVPRVYSRNMIFNFTVISQMFNGKITWVRDPVSLGHSYLLFP